MITRRLFNRFTIQAAFSMAAAVLLAGFPVAPVQLWASGFAKGGRVVVYSYGPARVLVTGPGGSRAGADLVTGAELEEIAGSDVAVERAGDRSAGWTITLSDTSPGVYHLDLLGTGTGRVVVDLEIRDAAGGISRSHVLEKVREGDAFRYSLDYDPAPGSGNKLESVPD